MTTTEIAPDVFRLSLYVPELNLQFNHFLDLGMVMREVLGKSE